MERPGRSLAIPTELVPRIISGFGVVVILIFGFEVLYFTGLDPDVLLTGDLLIAALTMAPFAGGIIYGGLWLGRSKIEPGRYHRAAKWCFAGAAAFLGLNLVMIVVWTPSEVWFAVGWIRNSANMGGAGGLLVGIVEARAIQNAIEAERSAIRARELETRREWLDYLNGLLRHEILNNAQVISGYSSMLMRADLDESRAEKLRTIRRQSQDMTRVTKDVRVLIEATRGEKELRPTNLSRVIDDEVQDLRDSYGAVEVEMDVAETVTVRADELLPRVFSNLMGNAVEHNDSDPPRVEVTAETTDDRVIVRVADNGPGVPDGMRAALFEQETSTRSDHGLGLYLVQQLVSRYDGRVELTETGPSGSVFTLELSRARPEGGGATRHVDPSVSAPHVGVADGGEERGAGESSD